ncbi:hypothetical protein J2T61_000362 [Methanocalculus sp. AMF5]|nr:hypothetical protein [Methanocalculus sp. AMF5]
MDLTNSITLLHIQSTGFPDLFGRQQAAMRGG